MDSQRVRAGMSVEDGVAELRRLASQGALDDAVALAETLIAGGGNAEIHGLLGYVHQQAGRFEPAAASCARAVDLGLEDWSIYLILAASLRSLGRPEEALTPARRALEMAPGRPDAASVLIEVVTVSQGLEAARAIVHAASGEAREALLEGWPPALANLIRRLLESDDVARAAETCRGALAVAPDGMLFHQLGEALRRQGDYHGAAEAYARGADYGVEDPGQYMLLGLGFREEERHAEASQAFANVLRLERRLDAALLSLEETVAADDLVAGRTVYERLRRSFDDRELELKWQTLQNAYVPPSIPVLLSEGRIDEAEAGLHAAYGRFPSRRVAQWLHYLDRYRQWLAFTSAQRSRADPGRKPSIQVYLVSYNHEKFIGAALEGVLGQQTDCLIEIHCVDDASTDGTQAVILDYQKRYPGQIKTYFNPTNVGTLDPPQQKVTYKAFTRLTADYCAILEGDDYWSDPLKLHKQITFLENNPIFACSSHNTLKIYEDNAQEAHRFLYFSSIRPVHTIDNCVAMQMFFHTSSVIYRNLLMSHPPKGFASKWSCDIFNTTAHMQYGELRYFDEDMSVYRQHAGGGYSGRPPLWGRIFNIEGLIRYNQWLGYRYLKDYAFSINRLTLQMLKECRAGDLPPMTWVQGLRYNAIAWLSGTVYDLLDRFPRLDPAVFAYREYPKISAPRAERLAAYGLMA